MRSLNQLMVKRYDVLTLIITSLIGAGIPLLAFSPTLCGIVLGLSIIAIILKPGRTGLFQDLFYGFNTPLGISIVLTLILWLPGVFESLDLSRSLIVWARMAVFILLSALIYHFLVHTSVSWCLRSLIIVSIFCLFIAFLGIHVSTPIYGVFRGYGLETVNPEKILKYYGSVLACLVPIVLWGGFRLGGAWRFLSVIHSVAAIVIIFTVDSFAGLLGLVSAMVVGITVLVSLRKNFLNGCGTKILLGILFCALVGFFTWIIIHLPSVPGPENIIDGVYYGTIDTKISTSIVDAHRQYIWAFAFQKGVEVLYFGHGIDISNFLPGASVLIEKFNQEFIPSHPHSWLLEIFLETGAIGLISLLVALGCLVSFWLRIGKTSPRDAACGIALLAAFWSSSMFNFSIWAAWWQGVFFILSAIVLASSRRKI